MPPFLFDRLPGDPGCLCATSSSVHNPLRFPLGSVILCSSGATDSRQFFPTMLDSLWNEIQDAPGEIFDLPEMAGWDDEESGIDHDDRSLSTLLESGHDF